MPLLYTVFQESFNILKQQYNLKKEKVYFTYTFGLRQNYYGIKHVLCQCFLSNQLKYCKMIVNSVPQPYSSIIILHVTLSFFAYFHSGIYLDRLNNQQCLHILVHSIYYLHITNEFLLF